jgi:hypothetical protein
LNGAPPNAITADAVQPIYSLLPSLTVKNVNETDLKIISVHTPKAGGTSIKTALANAFGPAFEIDYSEDPADPRSPRQLDPEGYFSRGRRLRDDIGCLHGHFHPGQFNLDDTFLFTLLRHPIDNIISIYFFWRDLASQGQPLHDLFLTNRMDILQMARLPLLRHLYSETYFGGFDMARFDLIGRHEDRADALDKLSRVAGVQIDASVHENATTISAEREELLSDRVRMHALGKVLEDDVRFYELYCT